MKKLLCLLLMVMMISVTGCTPKESAAEIYKKAMEQSMKYESVTMDVDMTLQLEVSGINVDMPITMAAKQINPQDLENAQMHINMNVSLLGEETDTEIWVKDGNEYVIANGEKSIVPYDPSDISGSFDLNLADYVENGTVENDGTNKVLTLEVSEDAYDYIIEKTFASTGMDDLDMTADDINISIDNITAVVDEDYNFVSMNMKFEVSVGNDDDKVKINADVNVDYSDINKTTIDFPDLTDFDKPTTSGTSYEGFDGEGRVCTEELIVISGDGPAPTMDFVLYADDNDIIQGIQMIFKQELPEFDDMQDFELAKSMLDNQLIEDYGGEGAYTSSTIENGIYQFEVDFTDMSTAGKLVGSGESFENKSIDEIISALEAQGATCK